MRRMRRPPALLCALAFALALVACTGDEPEPAPSRSTAPSASPPSPEPTGATGKTATPTGTSGSTIPPPQPDVHLPKGMPAVVDDPADEVAISAGDLTPLIPVGSNNIAASPGLRTSDSSPAGISD